MTRLNLAIALSRCAGLVLTRELATQVLGEVYPVESRAFPIERMGVGGWGSYTFAAERVAAIEPELRPLHAQYHLDTRGGLADNPDYDFARLREAERDGAVVMFTSRFKGELVGIMRVRVGRNLESQRLVACDDMFFIKAEHRGSMMAVRLWQFMERAMFEAGVREVTFDSLTINGAESMARFLGYQQVAIKFHKVAQDGCDYSTVPTRHTKE